MCEGVADGPKPAETYGDFSFRSDMPSCPNTHVITVETKLVHHMDEMALGSPLESNKTVKSILDDITACQGCKIQGNGTAAFNSAVDYIMRMLREGKEAEEGQSITANSSSSASTTSGGSTSDIDEIMRLRTQLVAEREACAAALEEAASRNAAALAESQAALAESQAELAATHF